ncbi:MAG: hypothetical protein J6K88_04825 [Oscillospiraceae bacterium]|nr:hypothetical protein [Oscillospiraceae bacterium]
MKRFLSIILVLFLFSSCGGEEPPSSRIFSGSFSFNFEYRKGDINIKGYIERVGEEYTASFFYPESLSNLKMKYKNGEASVLGGSSIVFDGGKSSLTGSVISVICRAIEESVRGNSLSGETGEFKIKLQNSLPSEIEYKDFKIIISEFERK